MHTQKVTQSKWYTVISLTEHYSKTENHEGAGKAPEFESSFEAASLRDAPNILLEVAIEAKDEAIGDVATDLGIVQELLQDSTRVVGSAWEAYAKVEEAYESALTGDVVAPELLASLRHLKADLLTSAQQEVEAVTSAAQEFLESYPQLIYHPDHPEEFARGVRAEWSAYREDRPPKKLPVTFALDWGSEGDEDSHVPPEDYDQLWVRLDALR